jgi:probable lipoprotein NlpC
MINKFIGIPFVEFGRDFSGCDCAGLVLLVYQHLLNVNLDDFVDYTSVNDRGNAVRIATYFHGRNFLRIPLEERQLGDCAVFSILARPMHVGIVLEDNKFLHTTPGAGSHIIASHNRYFNKLESIWRMN